MRLLLILLLWSPHIFAEGIDGHDQEALQQTQQLMKDKKAREAAIAGDDKAEKADDFLKKIVGGDAKMTEEVYALAAEIFATVVQESGGDAAKMQEKLAEFARNPASFAAKWTPEQKARLKQLAEKLGKPSLAPK